MSWLFEQPDFADLVSASAEEHGIDNPAIVEKDYYVTEALRCIAAGFGDSVIFKGGTSLSKGWKIIERFSEDIDLYVQPKDSPEETAERFGVVADAVAAFPGFSGRRGRRDKGSSSWIEEFEYRPQSQTLGGINPVVLLEAGIQSADQPCESVTLRSLLGETLDAHNVEPITDDRPGFPMELLHFRRTFVEKLFTIHSRVARAIQRDGKIGRDARHYYDLAMLSEKEEVRAMLVDKEYAEICSQYYELTERFFKGQLKHLPTNKSLMQSPALFPDAELAASLGEEYLREVETLCYGEAPDFESVLAKFAEIRDWL